MGGKKKKNPHTKHGKGKKKHKTHSTMERTQTHIHGTLFCLFLTCIPGTLYSRGFFKTQICWSMAFWPWSNLAETNGSQVPESINLCDSDLGLGQRWSPQWIFYKNNSECALQLEEIITVITIQIYIYSEGESKKYTAAWLKKCI